jgi:hypothetical protein
MLQLLLIDQDPNFSKVVKLNLMKAYDFNVIEKETIADALDILEMLPDISLIIIRNVVHFNSKVNDLIKFLKDNNSKVPVLSDGKVDYEKSTVIADQTSWKELIDSAGKILGFNKLASYSEAGTEYVPVPLSYFYNIHETSFGCDVYIRIKKNETEYHFFKRLNSTDYFERKDIEKYQNAGLKEFHIHREHFTTFVNYLTDKLTLQLSDKKLQGKERLQLAAEVFELTVDRISSLGIDERSMDIVSEGVKSMQASLGSNNALSDFLALMMKNQLSYNYAHSFLVCLLLNKIIRQFEWDSANVREKISYIAFFHDIALKDPEFAKFQSMEALDKADVTAEQKIQIQQHAFKASQILDQFNNIPIGIAALVREHHGMKAGVGFTTTPGNNISPLSMIFIVVEHFAGEFLKIDGPPKKSQLDEILTDLEKIYSKGTYHQAVEALRNSIGL